MIDLKNKAQGDILNISSINITRETLLRYAGLSQDYNPIHYNDIYAKEAGLRGVIAHGMLTQALVISNISEIIDTEKILEYKTTFIAPVLVDAQEGASLIIESKLDKLDKNNKTAKISFSCFFEGNGDFQSEKYEVVKKSFILIDIS